MQVSNLREQTLAIVRQSLVAGEYRPGDIISAAAMASRLNVSNSPVREAMLELVSQGILEVVRNRGFRVLPMSDHDLDEVYEVRLWLEARAMRELAARKINVESSRPLAQLTIEKARAEEIPEFLDADRSFHLGLLAHLDNTRLSRIVENMRDQTRLYGIHALAAAGKLVQTSEEHLEIVDAINSGDPDAAEAAMTRHLAHIRSDWSSGIAQ
ncbi:GntR family transcriptional regulator [Microbacterium sp.]|uniref:GntR family transcriptional regulator n=1 Tax=Microbacterium sp. TaxID=51671 RepID=UPI0039E6AB49